MRVSVMAVHAAPLARARNINCATGAFPDGHENGFGNPQRLAGRQHIIGVVCAGGKVRGISGQFAEQAGADLRLAREASRDYQSGHSLGEAMFLAQQCIEKQLKAIILRLNEAMCLERGDRFLRGLSHEFYPKLNTVRRRFVRGLGLPPAPVLRLVGREPGEAAFERNERVIGSLWDFWKRCAEQGSVCHVAMWKHSLHVGLSACELESLSRFFDVGAAGQSAPKVELGGYSTPPPMRYVIEDRRRTESVYNDYRGDPLRQELQEMQDSHSAHQDLIFSETALKRLECLPADGQARAVRRLVAEFAFEAASTQASRYAPLFPHNTMGRYPMRLIGGKSTTDVYREGADVVLHWVYNKARFDLGLLREQASKVDELCELGHEHGYW